LTKQKKIHHYEQTGSEFDSLHARDVRTTSLLGATEVQMRSDIVSLTCLSGRRSGWRQFDRQGASVRWTGRRRRGGTSRRTDHRWSCTRSGSAETSTLTSWES